MPLLGRGVFVAWHDVADGAVAGYDAWHSAEHMLERVAIPGFLRGRRHTVVGEGPYYLVTYETIDAEVLASPAYFERLNNPTPATRAIMPFFRNMNRTLCHVEATFGVGLGAAMLTIQLSPLPGRAEELSRSLVTNLARLAAMPGINGAHLLVAMDTPNAAGTRETELRGGPDTHADWVVLVEGFDPSVVRAVVDAALAPARLEATGASARQASALYRLAHVVTREDLPANG